MMFPNIKVLLAEDKTSGAVSLKGLLDLQEMDVTECSDSLTALRYAFSINPDLIILDAGLPQMDTLHTTRILKNDPYLKLTPIIVFGKRVPEVDRAWILESGSDYYLETPIDAEEIEAAIKEIFVQKVVKSARLAPASITATLDDTEILSLANSILDRQLYKAELINRINSIDIQVITLSETVRAVMDILASLYEFSSSMVLFNNDEDALLFSYSNPTSDTDSIKETESLFTQTLYENFSLSMDRDRVVRSPVKSDLLKRQHGAGAQLYVHSPVAEKRAAFLAFANLETTNLSSDEFVTLRTFLNTASRLLENKFAFDASQRLSIIDTLARKENSNIFYDATEREMRRSIDKKTPLTMLTLNIDSIDDLLNELNKADGAGLMRSIFRSILSSISKTNIVIRLDTASFAMLMVGASADKTEPFERGLKGLLSANIKNYLSPGVVEPTIHTEVTQFAPLTDATAEDFLARASSKPLQEPIDTDLDLDGIDDTIIDLEDIIEEITTEEIE